MFFQRKILTITLFLYSGRRVPYIIAPVCIQTWSETISSLQRVKGSLHSALSAQQHILIFLCTAQASGVTNFQP